MDHDLEQRARALGRLIEGMAERDSPDFGSETGDGPSWGAAELLATLLQKATVRLTELSPEEASELVGPERLRVLEDRGLLRVVLGSVRTISPTHVPNIEEADAEDLKKLRQEAARAHRTKLWAPREMVLQAIDEHRRAHPTAPGDDSILGPFDEGNNNGPGYWISMEATPGWWSHKVRVAASVALWHRRTLDTRSSQLEDWMARVGSVAYQVPYSMSPTLRERLADEAMALVKRECAFGSFDDHRASDGSDVVDEDAGPRDTPGAALLALNDSSTHEDQWHDDTRAALALVVVLVLRCDRAQLGHKTRVAQLAELGQAHPFLLRLVSQLIGGHRPEAIAWLTANSLTATLGLVLLRDLRIQEPTFVSDWPTRLDRIESRRRLLLSEALPMLFRGRESVSDAQATAIVDALRIFAKPCHGGTLYEESQRRAEINRAREQFDLVTSHISAALTAQNQSRAATDGNVATQVVQHLLKATSARFAPGEHAEFALVAHALMRVLQGQAVSEHVNLVALARATARRMGQALELSASEEDYWYYPRPSLLVEQDWSLTACRLTEGNEVEALTNLPELSKAARRAANEPELAQHRTVRGIVARLRVQLEVLLRAYTESFNILFVPGSVLDETRTRLEYAARRIVDAQTDLLAGSVDVFDSRLEVGVSGEEAVASLVRQTVRTFASFPEGRDREALSSWIQKTVDPLVLLNIDRALTDSTLQGIARERLESSDLLTRAEKDTWFTALVDMVYKAAAGQHTELAERLLRRGDERTKGHPWRAKWDRIAFRSRLLLAYHQGDRNSIEHLPLPDSAVGSGVAPTEQRTVLERSRKFYFALSEIKTNPESARRAFAAQRVDDPDSVALILNYFAAWLNVAGGLGDPETSRVEFSKALSWWREISKSVPHREDLEPTGTINELCAIEGAGLDAEFERFWTVLGADLKRHPEAIAVRLENLKRRGFAEEHDQLLERARHQFGAGFLEHAEVVGRPAPLGIEEKELGPGGYRRYWSDIRDLPPEEAAAVVGATRERDLFAYLRQVHVSAALEVLRVGLLVFGQKDEDRSSDFFVSLLRMRLALLGWEVRDQSRGGSSGSGKTLGRRDWVIAHHNREVCISEAMRLGSVDTRAIDEHICRLLRRYNPQGAEIAFVCVFYEGHQFGKFLDRYRKHVAEAAFGEWKHATDKRWRRTSNSLQTLNATATTSERTVRLCHMAMLVESSESSVRA